MSFNKPLQRFLSLVLLSSIPLLVTANTTKVVYKSGNKSSNKSIVVSTKGGKSKPAQLPTYKNKSSHHKQKPSYIYRPTKKPVVIVHKPSRRSYTHVNLPRATTFVIIAGISYAVIDNAYYKRHNNTYIYVESPPVVTTATQDTGYDDTNNFGHLVSELPHYAKKVSVDGATFYVTDTDWYAPISGGSQFVIVAPQL